MPSQVPSNSSPSSSNGAAGAGIAIKNKLPLTGNVLPGHFENLADALTKGGKTKYVVAARDGADALREGDDRSTALSKVTGIKKSLGDELVRLRDSTPEQRAQHNLAVKLADQKLNRSPTAAEISAEIKRIGNSDGPKKWATYTLGLLDFMVAGLERSAVTTSSSGHSTSTEMAPAAVTAPGHLPPTVIPQEFASRWVDSAMTPDSRLALVKEFFRESPFQVTANALYLVTVVTDGKSRQKLRQIEIEGDKVQIRVPLGDEVTNTISRAQFELLGQQSKVKLLLPKSGNTNNGTTS